MNRGEELLAKESEKNHGVGSVGYNKVPERNNNPRRNDEGG